jgi:hypothetical protein
MRKSLLLEKRMQDQLLNIPPAIASTVAMRQCDGCDRARGNLSWLVPDRSAARARGHLTRLFAKLRCQALRQNWLQGTDSNRRPSGYEPDALNRCATLPNEKPAARPFDTAGNLYFLKYTTRLVLSRGCVSFRRVLIKRTAIAKRAFGGKPENICSHLALPVLTRCGPWAPGGGRFTAPISSSDKA